MNTRSLLLEVSHRQINIHICVCVCVCVCLYTRTMVKASIHVCTENVSANRI